MFVAHPDAGGTVGLATQLNRAIAQVRSGEAAHASRPPSRPVHAADVRQPAAARTSRAQGTGQVPRTPRRRTALRRFAWLAVLCVAVVLLVAYWQLILLGLGALWALAVVMGAVTE